jgi:hypothetical protein
MKPLVTTTNVPTEIETGNLRNESYCYAISINICSIITTIVIIKPVSSYGTTDLKAQDI